MARQLIFCLLAFSGAMGTTDAGHFFRCYSRPVVGAPVVAYQSAYVVPTMSYAVTQMPITAVSYAPAYYGPAYYAPAYYAPAYYAPAYYAPAYYAPAYYAPAYSAPAYSAPAYYAPTYYAPAPVYAVPAYGYGQRIHSHLNVHRNGTYNYHLRVR
ncbi:MAG: hypothetical protein NTX48_08595 [Planctomycetales bacterium]|nr:hypothetical protein [Planctomycetales bacterium]